MEIVASLLLWREPVLSLFFDKGDNFASFLYINPLLKNGLL